jgi:hypothetical protein
LPDEYLAIEVFFVNEKSITQRCGRETGCRYALQTQAAILKKHVGTILHRMGHANGTIPASTV